MQATVKMTKTEYIQLSGTRRYAECSTFMKLTYLYAAGSEIPYIRTSASPVMMVKTRRIRSEICE